MSANVISFPQSHPDRNILGIKFFTGDANSAVTIGAQGGLVVAPAAPALCELGKDLDYRDALHSADLVITDSGFLVLLWNLTARDKIRRVSGLKYLRTLLSRSEFKQPGAAFWVMPSAAALQRNLAWLKAQGCKISPNDCYVAPRYGAQRVSDQALLDLVNQRRPRHIIVCVGGGTQEKLGLYLKQHCTFRPAIHCIGAAIGFLTGDQVAIPDWADRLVLGWLFRCVSDPGRFVPRYWRALKLPWILWRHQKPGPTLEG